MTLDTLPGSVTRPDPLELENDRLREQVATLAAERDATRQQLEDLAYSHSLCGDLRDECINAETEACARLANRHINNVCPGSLEREKGYRDACADLESAIRARGAK